MGYKCVNCGTIKQNGDDFWRVRIVTTDGKTEYVPTCSNACATEVQKENIAMHELRAYCVKEQQFQRMEWGKYPNEQ